MSAAIVVFPGSNCDRDVAVALEAATGMRPQMVWHAEAVLPKVDLIVLPGGFSYGDYLRAGAIAAHSPVLRDVVRRAHAGAPVLGICNGFQILTETGLLPGVLLRNARLNFVSRWVHLRIEAAAPPFTSSYRHGQVIRIPVAHHDGNYAADGDTLARLEAENRIAFRYCAADGETTPASNPNGSAGNIAGITNERRNVLGLMPHPERAAEPAHGGEDGRPFFAALAAIAA